MVFEHTELHQFSNSLGEIFAARGLTLQVSGIPDRTMLTSDDVKCRYMASFVRFLIQILPIVLFPHILLNRVI